MFKRRDWIGSDIALFFIGILLCFILYERWGVEKLLEWRNEESKKKKDESLFREPLKQKDKIQSKWYRKIGLYPLILK